MAVYHLRAARPSPDGASAALAYEIHVDADCPQAATQVARDLPDDLTIHTCLVVWLTDSAGRVIWSLPDGAVIPFS